MIEFQHVTKSFKDNKVLSDISLTIEDGGTGSDHRFQRLRKDHDAEDDQPADPADERQDFHRRKRH